MDFVIGFLNLIMVIVFFVMTSNIAKIRKMNFKQIQQNDEIISLLKRSTGLMSDADKAKAFDQGKK